jgi:hypothetical protein
MGFKTNAYNTINPPTEVDAHRFGEKARDPKYPTPPEEDTHH